MTLGEKLQLLRKSRGLSQEQLAEVLEVSRQAVSKWENNDSEPDLDKLRAICTYFGVTTDYLIWEDPENAPQGSDPTQKADDHAARREATRAFVRENGHWLGYALSIVGAVQLCRMVFPRLALWIAMRSYQRQWEAFPEVAEQYNEAFSQTISTFGTVLLPYYLLYGAMIVGGLLLARWMKKRSKERKAHDDL